MSIRSWSRGRGKHFRRRMSHSGEWAYVKVDRLVGRRGLAAPVCELRSDRGCPIVGNLQLRTRRQHWRGAGCTAMGGDYGTNDNPALGARLCSRWVAALDDDGCE